jgi:hypothetical protein
LTTYIGVAIQGSNDGNSWKTLYTISNEIKLGLNTILFTDPDAYQSFRVAGEFGNCDFAELNIWGYRYS